MSNGTGDKERFDISLEDLQTFIAVGDLASFSRAADRLSLSQPSVSNRVRRLEEKVGVRLLDRTSRRVELTEDGQRLHVRASMTLGSLRDLLREFRASVGARRLQINVAATIMVTTVALPPIIAAFSSGNPDISVRLTDLSPAGAIAEVATGAVDMAVLASTELPPGLEFELLVEDRCAVVTGLGHPLLAGGSVTLAEVLAHPLLSPDGHVALRRAVLAEAEARGLSVQLASPALGVSNVMTLLAMAAAGLGVCIHPPSLIMPEFRPTIGVVGLSDCDIVRSFGIVTATDRTLSAPARKFREYLRATARAGRFGSGTSSASAMSGGYQAKYPNKWRVLI